MKITAKDVEALKRFKPTMDAFAAVNALVDDQTTLESLQNAHSETEARLNDKREQEKGIDARLQACADAETYAKDIKAKAESDADDIRANAHLDGDKIKEEAQHVAGGITDRAKEKAKTLTDKARADLADIEKLTDAKRTEFTELADAKDAKQKELDQLNADLEAAKAHIQLLLKGN